MGLASAREVVPAWILSRVVSWPTGQEVGHVFRLGFDSSRQQSREKNSSSDESLDDLHFQL
ncbi:hypothetical protein L917_07750 [Phytophthora nicotianae]|nr:hypothetical protein L915_07928 [Phytophthora nicotianae]ETL41096.1 hypothetical protein L916_07856 [Phytophthora nicotianae]ETL94248.1 hypothetical protein L917_07750 [Phytophthora nicotianae]ETO76465.1 hypothetical protein F444_08149 [Phytophthora nicotianae P1976]